jgi:hypothetical protein
MSHVVISTSRIQQNPNSGCCRVALEILMLARAPHIYPFLAVPPRPTVTCPSPKLYPCLRAPPTSGFLGLSAGLGVSDSQIGSQFSLVESPTARIWDSGRKHRRTGFLPRALAASFLPRGRRFASPLLPGCLAAAFQPPRTASLYIPVAPNHSGLSITRQIIKSSEDG